MKFRKVVNMIRGDQSISSLLFIEKSKLLDTQEESGVVLRVEDEVPLGGCTGTVTECGEHGNQKKMNPEDKKIR